MSGFHVINARKANIRAHRIEAIAELLSEGLSPKAIQEQLQISHVTFNKDFRAICDGLGAQAV